MALPAALAIRPQLRRHFTAITLQGLAVGSGGALTASGSAVTLYVSRRSLELNHMVEKIRINGASSTRTNEVIDEEGDSLNLEILIGNGGAEPDQLRAFCESFDYGRVAWTTGTTTGSIEAWAFIGLRGNLTRSNPVEGFPVSTLEFGPVDIGAPQLTRAVS